MVAIKKSIETRSRKTGKLTGRQSLAGKVAPKSAAKKKVVVAKKSALKKIAPKKTPAKKVPPKPPVKESPPAKKVVKKKALPKSPKQIPINLGLTLNSTPGFLGTPLFAYDYPENVDKFGLILRGSVSISDIRRLSLSESSYRFSNVLSNALDEAMAALESYPVAFEKYNNEWITKHDALIPSGLSEEIREDFENAITLASYADLAVRVRDMITKGSYNALSLDWRTIVGAIDERDNDIFVETD